MAKINCNDDPNGKQHNFELTVAYIMPTYPVALRIARGDPIVDNKTNEMLGIISENDVLDAYLKISEEINQIEKH